MPFENIIAYLLLFNAALHFLHFYRLSKYLEVNRMAILVLGVFLVNVGVFYLGDAPNWLPLLGIFFPLLSMIAVAVWKHNYQSKVLAHLLLVVNALCIGSIIVNYLLG